MRRINFKDLSISKKLSVIIMGTTGVALLLACASFFIYEYIAVPRNVAQNLSSLASVTGNNVAAAILFNDEIAARETLNAFRATPNVVRGVVCRKDGKLFAKYERPDSSHSSLVCAEQLDRYRVVDGQVELSQAILLRGERVGTVTLSGDLGEMRDRLWNYGKIVLLVMVLSFGVAYVIARRLQYVVSAPLLDLAALAKQVSLDQNYSVRAQESSRDEIGYLVEGFNNMLSQIERRDRALKATQAELESRVVDLQREIVERQRAEDGLAKQTLELQRSNTELEQFAYVASHDLQEPLRMVSSYTQLLAKRYRAKLDADALEFIDFAVDGVKRMQTLIKDLLEFSRVGTRGKEFAPVNSGGVVQAALGNLSAALKERGAQVTVAPLPIVLADERQLVQLFQNLIGNAIKYCNAATPMVHLSCDVADGQCQFSIKDNGIGIAPEFAERIFILFQRLHGKDEYEGTGIGLAICKKIVERHGGKIWVDSTPGQGSTFKFILPVAQATNFGVEACL